MSKHSSLYPELLQAYRGLISKALGKKERGPKLIGCHLYQNISQPEAVIADFQVDGEQQCRSLGYLPEPAALDPAKLAVFRSSLPSRGGYREIEDLSLRKSMLENLLAGLEGKHQACLTPLPAEQSPEPKQGPAPDRASFRALALDKLGGWADFVEPDGKAVGLTEVWAFKGDDLSTALVRRFSDSSALAVAAVLTRSTAQNYLFLDALQKLIARRVGANLPTSVLARGADLDQLQLLKKPKAIGERLGRALSVYLAGDLLTFEPGLLGQVEESALEELSCIRMRAEEATDEEMQQEEAEELTSEDFYLLAAQKLLSEEKNLLWTQAREARAAERIEVLTHTEVHGVLALLYFLDDNRSAGVGVYLPPGLDPLEHNQVLDDLSEMAEARGLFGPEPEPLSGTGALIRLETSSVNRRLRETLTALSQGKGCAHVLSAELEGEAGEREPGAFDASGPPSGTRLH